jgi:hypothetical protein
MYDQIFEVDLPAGASVTCFADDTAIIATAKSARVAGFTARRATHSIVRWIESRDLEVAESKTEAVVFTTRKTRNIRTPQFVVKGHKVESKNHLKYLGVILDKRLTYTPHVGKTAEKALQVSNTVGRLVPNLGGPMPEKRRLLSRVAETIALYATPV